LIAKLTAIFEFISALWKKLWKKSFKSWIKCFILGLARYARTLIARVSLLIAADGGVEKMVIEGLTGRKRKSAPKRAFHRW
jgi:hypothetical protein